MIRMDVVRAAAGGARKVGTLTRRATRHALWYVQYRTRGTSRDAPRNRGRGR